MRLRSWGLNGTAGQQFRAKIKEEQEIQLGGATLRTKEKGVPAWLAGWLASAGRRFLGMKE
ncbi:hypothetical protein HJFPF1_01466 [Paramyrothecium foliicola]|nr:hypothetical protein HJFPF1_01466 [Paramyrothecium foliicola]